MLLEARVGVSGSLLECDTHHHEYEDKDDNHDDNDGKRTQRCPTEGRRGSRLDDFLERLLGGLRRRRGHIGWSTEFIGLDHLDYDEFLLLRQRRGERDGEVGEGLFWG